MNDQITFESILESSTRYTNLYLETNKQVLEILKSEEDGINFKIKSLLREFAINIIDKLKQFKLGKGRNHAKKHLDELMNRQYDFLKNENYIDNQIRLIIDKINPNNDENIGIYTSLFNFALMTSSSVAMIIKGIDIDTNNKHNKRK